MTNGNYQSQLNAVYFETLVRPRSGAEDATLAQILKLPHPMREVAFVRHLEKPNNSDVSLSGGSPIASDDVQSGVTE